MKMPTIICCRCSPSQKKLLTAGVKRHKNPHEAVLGIGDGGNDVGMIQAAATITVLEIETMSCKPMMELYLSQKTKKMQLQNGYRSLKLLMIQLII